MGYHDMQEHLKLLESKGLLIRVKREINKDTELHPLVRWQFRGGFQEKDRKAFLFENVVDSLGRKYSIPVTVGALSASNDIYALGLQCEVDEINEVWERALSKPIKPIVLSDDEHAPSQEVVILKEEIEKNGNGLEKFPIPVSTPGFDNAPYTTCSHFISKDPETGVRNAGNYRGMIKSSSRVGIFSNTNADFKQHWLKCKELGRPFLEVALVVGAPPVVTYATVQKVPFETDEFAVAGGLAGEPIRMVKCKTIDLDVPAEAEIVIEGLVSTDTLEIEGPFGESHGHMNPKSMSPYLDVTAITHRKNPLFVSIISQVTPSESSVLKRDAFEQLFLRYIRNEVGVRSVVKVVMHEPLVNLRKFIILQMKNPSESEVWRALFAAANFRRGLGKIVIAVDEDIDPYNLDSIFWAMSYRMQPHQDVQIIKGREKGHGPPFTEILSKSGDEMVTESATSYDSALLVNAILKEPFPPVSLPKKEYMEAALKIWQELGLPEVNPQNPWYGYSLGDWDSELDEEALLAVKGEHFKTGEKFAGMRKKV